MSPGSIRPRSWAEWPQTPGVAVGLQLEPHGQLVGLVGGSRLLRLAHLGRWCPSRFCTWCPSSWARTYTRAKSPGALERFCSCLKNERSM